MATGTPSDRLQGSSPGGSTAPRDVKGTAQDVAQAAKEQAGAVWSNAKETARSKLTEQQRGAASNLGDLAQALRRAARDLEGERQGAARMVQWTADGLERVSSTLASKDLDTMMRDIGSFARNQPVAFFGAAIAAGFLATRFLKASSSSQAESAGPSAGTDFTSTTRY